MKQAEPGSTAKSHIKSIKARHNNEDLPLPRWCKAEAPEEVNSFTDGSLKVPTIQELSLGGFGIWQRVCAKWSTIS